MPNGVCPHLSVFCARGCLEMASAKQRNTELDV
ncbi:uncharacterized protein CLUP02_16529 [Colletotrichum lupini]|uniref:Uncharacterized protein n=1 Tax=Colletotrichum lupini TaxID=145971 RepID=A0A9Q8WPR4_9PEZI|nr:uncharacterized protein CLUP02_16529 [Colletotrichum lupini]UQC90996.1 hypothetical protein CLUP02_16529 [Colletotrichum lupini]